MIKAAFFDVDGTLLSYKTKQVCPSAKAAIAKLQEQYVAATYMCYDNPGIKVYSYMLDEVEGMHRFEQSVVFNGVKMLQCSDCSYAVIEQ